MFKRSILQTAVLAGLMAEATSGEEAQSSGGSAEGAEKRKRAPKTNLLDIARGRLPLALVYAVRFNEKGTNAEVAKKMATSVGKVFDIRKNRNFAYVTEDYKLTDEDRAAALKWAEEAEKHGGDKQGIIDAIEAITPATAEDAKAQAEKHTAARAKTKGNGKSKPKVDAAPAVGEPSAADLTS